MDYLKEFPHKQEYVFINHCAISPPPLRAVDMANRFLKDVTMTGSLNWNQWLNIVDETRIKAGQLIGADKSEIAFIKNTTEGLLKIANAIDWKSGDNVIIFENEFPANVYPWLNLKQFGVDVRIVPEKDYGYKLEDIAKLIDENTRLLAVSFVEYTTGFQNDLKSIGELCKKKDILFVVDGIQGVGAIPIHVKDCHIDFMAQEGQKWLLTTEGIGFMYVNLDAMKKLTRFNYGYMAKEQPEDFLNYSQSLCNTARLMEEGSWNMLGIFMLHGALELLLEVGQQQVFQTILSHVDFLKTGLETKGYNIITPLSDPKHRSGIIACVHATMDAEAIWKHMIKNKVICSSRRGWLRMAPHFHNSVQELERVLQVLP